MKLSTIVPFTFATLTLANFHIGTTFTAGLSYDVACPSNYQKCLCWTQGDRQGRLPHGDTYDGTPYFQVDSVCGVGPLDFWKQDNGSWLVYKKDGNGDLQGECWPANANPNDDVSCAGRTSYRDRAICYSYICGA